MLYLSQFLVGTWWIWLVVMLVSIWYLLINRRSAKRRMLALKFNRPDDNKVHKAVFTGFVPMVIAIIVAEVSFIFFIIGLSFIIFPD